MAIVDNGEPGRALLLDAVLSDIDVNNNLRAILQKCLSCAKIDAILPLEPLIAAVVETWAVLGSLEAHGVTPGQKCVSLCYTNAPGSFPSTVMLAGVEEPLKLLLSKYVPKLCAAWAEKRAPHLRVSEAVEKLSVLLRLFELCNTLVFLVEGRYPTLWLRVLGVRQTPSTRETFHREDFSSVGREAMWHTFREATSVLLPFAQLLRTYLVAHVVRRLRSRWKKPVKIGLLVVESPDFCALCRGSPPILSVVALRSACRHCFCYACIEGEPLFNGGFVCPICCHSVRLDLAVFSSTGLPLP